MIELRNAGINDLYVGVESGWNEVLEHINKGHSIAEGIQQFGKKALTAAFAR